MARLGAEVTGIDVTAPAISAAKTHAESMQLAIDYQVITAENLAASDAKFNVIYASEVIEHVAERVLFIKAIATMLAPNGVVVITTINRTLPALIFAKFALEYIARLVPAGTHDPRKFVRPAELRAEFAAAGIVLDDMTGFAPYPGGGFTPIGSLAINYAASGGFR
jgi:2-polyprenyl-6-hydroxyphenyl methylase/3-demethylubiquinone-9 3-methyltransferase